MRLQHGVMGLNAVSGQLGVGKQVGIAANKQPAISFSNVYTASLSSNNTHVGTSTQIAAAHHGLHVRRG